MFVTQDGAVTQVAPLAIVVPGGEGAEGNKHKLVIRIARELVESGEGRRIPLNELIKACIDQVLRGRQAKCDNRRRDFMRAIEALVAANQVEVSDGYVQVAMNCVSVFQSSIPKPSR